MAFNTIFSKNRQINTYERKPLEMYNGYVQMTMPLFLELNSGITWQFPIEPLISISGKNVIVKRNVAKSIGRGTIKERWAQDDFAISIQGSFVDVDPQVFPEKELKMLYEGITQKGSIKVENELFQMLDIHNIVIEDFAFPFSKGENVQNFSLSGYSDDITQLFIDLNDV